MYQLFLQLILSGIVIAIAVAVQAWTVWAAARFRPFLARRLARIEFRTITLVISLYALWMLAGMIAGVWIWTLVLLLVGGFEALEPTIYFALAAYTTLGFGDVLPDEDWRILGAMIGANGMLGFGLATAALVNFITSLRDDLRT